KKISGVVIDGGIRDTHEIRKLGFPAYARVISSAAGEPKGFGEIGVPITVCGTKVFEGDYIIGDDDGIVVVPRQKAVEIANRAMSVLEMEDRLREEIKKGSTLAKVIELLRWEKT
nr:bifunctional hexulose-6-phosphate synthase/ribonuclease regulator [Candidatus Omnitrophota bacterium]